MKLKLKRRDFEVVEFSRDLPPFLGDGENPTKFVLRGRPAGSINPEYMAAVEALSLKSQVDLREMEQMEGQPEKNQAWVDKNHATSEAIVSGRFAALYDACIESWETGIRDAETDEVIDATRENFLELAHVKGVPELAAAMMDAEVAFQAAGGTVLQADEDTEKN